MVVRRAADDYGQQLAALLPPGPAWEHDFQPALHTMLGALASEFARADARSADLLGEAFLNTFHEVLQDWERVLGLPDVCLPGDASVADRKAAVLNRLVEKGGQTPAFFVELAKRAGYKKAWLAEYRAPRFGVRRFGGSHFGTWHGQFMWVLHAGERLPGGLRFGSGVWGERFGAESSDVLVCLMRRAAPAHTIGYVESDGLGG